jgi:hypothetical protein
MLWFLGRTQDDWLSGMTETVRQTWEAVNTRWNIWFMGFSAEDQIALLKRIGISAGRQRGWLLVLALPPLFIAGVIVLGNLRKKDHPKPFDDSVLKIYGRFVDKMARAGIPKASHQGPLDYGRLLMTRYPALEQDVAAIIGRYIGLRYGREPDLDALKAFRLRVRRFNPRRAMAAGRRAEDGGQRTDVGCPTPETMGSDPNDP